MELGGKLNWAVGERLSSAVGEALGWLVGVIVGLTLGEELGEELGAVENNFVGVTEGKGVGEPGVRVGRGLRLGPELGH